MSRSHFHFPTPTPPGHPQRLSSGLASASPTPLRVRRASPALGGSAHPPAVLCSPPDAAAGAGRPEPQPEMSSRNRSAASSCVAPAAAPSLRTPRRLRRRPVKAPTGAPCGGRRSGPATPLLKWDVGGGRGEGRKGAGAADEAWDAARETKAREVSVRRLKAGVWRLRRPEAMAGGGGGGGESRVRVGVEVCSCCAASQLGVLAYLFCFRLDVEMRPTYGRSKSM